MPAAPEVLQLGALVLPGSTSEFADPSTVYRLTDARGREHLSRRRVGCCYYYKVSENGEACAPPARGVNDAERVERYVQSSTSRDQTAPDGSCGMPYAGSGRTWVSSTLLACGHQLSEAAVPVVGRR